jgi:hypothetical protein
MRAAREFGLISGGAEPAGQNIGEIIGRAVGNA